MKFLLTCLVLLNACQFYFISAAPTVDTACHMLVLTNGKVICNGDGVFARFECDKGYSLYGEESSIFAEGVWSNGVPRCVKRGCKLPKNNPHVKMTQLPKYNNGVVNIECDIGFIREGPQLLYCDGVRWSDDFPSCKTYFGDQTGCDFEDKNICGWIQDNSEVLDWVRNRGPTLSSGTGPLTDHTTGTTKGHYMYLENASLRHRKQLARLISVPYTSKPNLALEFYYHMLGDNIGNLSVYLMPTQMNPLQLNVQHRIFYKSEAQGPSWLPANVLLQTQEKQFQLVFEATSGGTFGDIAIDDIRIIDLEELPLNDGIKQLTVNETSPSTTKKAIQSPKNSTKTSKNTKSNKKTNNKNTKKEKTTPIKLITSSSMTSEIYSSGTTGVELISSKQVPISSSTLFSKPTSAKPPSITTQSTLAPETTSTPTATTLLTYTSIGTNIQPTPTSSTSVITTQPLESSPATTRQSTIQTSASSIPNITTLTSNSPQTTTRKSTPVTSASTTSTSTKLTSQSSTSTKLTSQSSTSTKLTSQSSTSTKLTSQSSTSTKLTSQSSTSTKLTSQSSTSTKVTSQSSTNTTLQPTFTTSYIAMRNSSSTPLLSTTYITTVNIKESSTTSYNTGKHSQKTTPTLPNQKKNLKNLDSKDNSLVPIIILCGIVLGIFVPIITLIIYKRCKTRTRQITTDENIEKENNDLEDSSSDDSNEKSKTIEETTKQESNDETVLEKGNENKDENITKEDHVPKLEDTSTTETKQVTVTTSANEEVRVQVVVQAELAVVSTENETCLELTNAVNEDMNQDKPEASAIVSVTEAALSELKADVLPSITEENIQDTEKIKDEITIQPDDQNKL